MTQKENFMNCFMKDYKTYNTLHFEIKKQQIEDIRQQQIDDEEAELADTSNYGTEEDDKLSEEIKPVSDYKESSSSKEEIKETIHQEQIQPKVE